MINAYIATPLTVEADAALQFAGSRAVTGGSCASNGGWLYYTGGSQFMLVKPGIYKVDFDAQITAAAAGDATLEIQLNGEGLAGGEMGATLAAAGLADVGRSVLIVVPRCAGLTVSVKNTSETEITVNNASLVLTRVC